MGEYAKPKGVRFLSKLEMFWWQLLLLLIFARPALCEQAFPVAGSWYLMTLLVSSAVFIWLNWRRVVFSSALNCFVLLFMAAMVVSVFFSRQPLFSLSRVVMYASNIMIFFVISSLSEERKTQVIRIFLFSAIVVSCYALFQYFVSFRHLHEYLIKNFNGVTDEVYFKMLARRRVFSTFCSPNVFASYLLMMLIVASGFLMNGFRNKGTRETVGRDCLLTAIIILCLSALLFTRSLGAVMALSITFLIYVLLRMFYLTSGPRLQWVTSRNVIFMLFFGVLIMAMLKFNEERIAQLLNWKDPWGSLSQRVFYWKTSIKVARDYFFTGVGWRQFGFYYEVYRPEVASSSQYAHNVFLQVACELGLYGMLAFLGVVACIAQLGFDKKIMGQQGLSLGLLLAAVVFMVHNCMDVSFYFGQAAFLWWSVLGLLNENPG